MRKVVLRITVMLLLVGGSPASADLMAIWDFGPNAPGYTLDVTAENVIGTPTLIVGNADYDTDGKDGLSYRDVAGTFHFAGQAAAWNDTSGQVSDARWIMTINTTGWEDMAIRWDYMSDNTGNNKGPTSFDFQYRVGSGSWTQILNDETIIRDDTWYEFSYDLQSITAIENQAIVKFRVNDLDRGSPDGHYRFDNLELTGVPEPATLLLLGTGGLWILTQKRWSV